jgi:hypothetical protein
MKFTAILAPLILLALSSSATPSSALEKHGYGYTKGLASKGFDNILKPAAALNVKPQVLMKLTYKVSHDILANTHREVMVE